MDPKALSERAHAPPDSGDRWYFPPVERHLLRSERIRQTFRVSVAQPPRSRGDAAPLPVVYVTDANEIFTLFREYAHLLQFFGVHPFPACILVGVGYPSDEKFAGLLLRARDNTLPDQPRPDEGELRVQRTFYSLHEGLLPLEPASKSWGGADDFRDFLADEVIPFVEKNYQTAPGGRTYFGHSGGGLFGLYILCTRPELFRNYVISSPGWFSYKGNDFGFRMLREFIAAKKLIQSTRLYMSVGSDEDFQPLYYAASKSGASLTADFYRVVALLRGASIQNLELLSEAIAGEIHISVWPIAFVRGVQTIFGMRNVAGLTYPRIDQ